MGSTGSPKLLGSQKIQFIGLRSEKHTSHRAGSGMGADNRSNLTLEEFLYGKSLIHQNPESLGPYWS